MDDELKRVLEHLLDSTLEKPPILLSSLQRDQLLAYASLLKHSPRHSFASWDSDEQGLEIHFKDSFLTLPKKTPEYFLDVGSGAGIPGIIYAILWPEVKATLLESQKKRCEFLEECLAKLNLQKRVTVICGRAEEKAHDPKLREKFDLVTARALASFPQFLEYTVGFVRVCGFLHALRGEKDAQALREHQALLKAFHLDEVSKHAYKLKEEDSFSRYVFLFQKTAACASTIPRSNNQIKK